MKRKTSIAAHLLGLSILMTMSPVIFANTPVWESDILKTAIPNRYISSESIALDSKGNPHIVSYSDNLYYSWYDGIKWNSEAILPVKLSVKNPSIAIWQDDTIHIVFSCNDALVHACRVGMEWEFDCLAETSYYLVCPIRLDSHGRPHIAYVKEHSIIVHAMRDQGTWVYDELSIDVSISPGLGFDLDSMDQPHLCFISSYNMIYLHHTNEGWNTETAWENLGSINWTTFRLDSSDNPHIAFYRSGFGVRYLTKTTEGWTTSFMDSGGADGLSLFLDSNDHPHLAFVSDGALTHLSFTGTFWDRETIDAPHVYWSKVSAISATTGILHVLAVNKTFSRISYMKQNEDGWDYQTIAAYGSYQNTNLVFDQNGDIHCVFTALSGNELQHGVRKNGTWSFEVLDDFMGIESGQCCIGFDDVGCLHITYYHAREKRLYHAANADGSWQREVVFEGQTVYDSQMITMGEGTVIILFSTDENLHLYRKYAGNWENDIFEPGAYRSVSIFREPSGKLHCAYYRGIEESWYSRYNLFYRYTQNGEWVEELIESINIGSGLETVRLVVSEAGIPSIGYGKVTQGTHSQSHYAMYGFRDEQGWHVDDIDYGSKFAWILDARGNPCVITRDTIRFISDNGEKMTSRVTGYNNKYSSLDRCSMIMDSSGRIHLLGDFDLVYAHQLLPVNGVHLEMHSNNFKKYQNFILNTYLRSEGSPLHQAPLCILLEYQNNYWFWPEWNDQFSVGRIDVHEKGSAFLPIAPFYWREDLQTPLNGLVLWGALLTEDLTGIIGGMDGIGRWEFSVR